MQQKINLILLHCLLFLYAGKAIAQCPGTTPLVIDAIHSTESRCQASGTTRIEASGGVAPYTYALTIGPVTAPLQSGKTFSALSIGNYTVEVTDNCNNKTSKTFTIAGSYSVPNVSNTLKSPTCSGLQDGSIVVNVTNGRAPFTYALIAPSPIVTAQQSSNSFTNLPAGLYTYQVKDSCSNIQTRTVTLANNVNNSFTINTLHITWMACDSFAVYYRLNIDAGSNFSQPYKSELKLPDGRTLLRWLTIASPIVEDTFRFTYSHIKNSSVSIELNITNACGTNKSIGQILALDMAISKATTGTCGGDYTYTFDKYSDNSTSTPNVHCNTITYSLISPTGVVLASQVNNSTFAGYPPASGYKVIREDCCSKDSLLFDWENLPEKPPPTYSIFSACKEGLAVIRVSSNSGVPGMLILLSGPPSVTLPSTEVKNHVYPDTIKNLFTTTLNGTIGYFGVGNYKFCFVDDCGLRDTTIVAVTASRIKKTSFLPTLVRGCVNNNKIRLYGTNNNSSTGMDEVTIKYGSTTIRKAVSRLVFEDSLINLAPGKYQIQYRYLLTSAGYFLKNMNGSCDLIDTSITVPTYRQPYFDNTTIIGSCGTDKLTQLKPDSASGLLPFEYKLTAGPQTRPAQLDPLFRNLTPGTYTMLMTDACGNSYSNSIAIDDLIKPKPDIFLDCQFNSLWLSAVSSNDYQYSWVHPNGSVVNDVFMAIDPITDNDIGTYKLIASSSVNGCLYQEDTSFRVDYCSLLPAGLKSFRASVRMGTVELKWQIGAEHTISYFVIERSSDKERFKTIFSVDASPNETNFATTDQNPATGQCWYRLKMVHINGPATQSKIVSVNTNPAASLMVYPVPIQHTNTITVRHIAASANASIQIVDGSGRRLISSRVNKNATQTIVVVQKLVKGAYWLVFMNGQQKHVAKMVKN